MNRKLFSLGSICFILLFFFAGFVYAQDSRPIVRIIYFLPKDRQPQPDINAKLDTHIKDVQQFFANQMEAHGFGRKTFQFETDAEGNAVVHHFIGEFTDEHYSNLSWTWDIWGEIDKQFDASKNIYLTVIDMSGKFLDGHGIGGRGGSWGSYGGKALVTVFTTGVTVTAHELGHAFGLPHDYRSDTKSIWKYTTDRMLASFCAAEWLNAHRAFNTDQSTIDGPPTIEMLPPSLASPPNGIRFRFKVTDRDGLHQVQLMTPEGFGYGGVLGCQGLNGNSNHTVEFITTALTPNSRSVSLQMIDVHGNLFSSENYPINITSVLPPPEVISIPDANLATAVRREIGNSITTHTLLNLRELRGASSEITDLTGLEHAHNLRVMSVQGVGIMVLDLSPLVGLTRLQNLFLFSNNISDISLVSNLTQLQVLGLSYNNISDISPLTSLIQLKQLLLGNNAISDISPLADLTQLQRLNLSHNNISDISPLIGLTQLLTLDLVGINISDISPLADLTQLTNLDLTNNSISDISVLSELTNLRQLRLSNNNISDISVLSGLTQLITLDLSNNAISDVVPLVELELSGIYWNSTGLSIEGNPLNYASVHTHIPAMQAKGIEVKFDNRAHSVLVKISEDTREGEAGTTLVRPFVVEALDEHGATITGRSVTFRISEGNGRLSVTNAITDADGRAQTTLTLGPDPGVIKIRVTAAQITYPVIFTVIVTEATRLVSDVNGDGVVNIQDLVLVSSNLGQTGENRADVNGDGVVNIQDLVMVAGALGQGTAASPSQHASDLEGLTAADIQQMLTQARQLALTDPAYLRGIAVLERLLARLLPKETALLPNYPNPFNPETWIPYQLAESAEVTLCIYAVDGTLVRTLSLGHKPIGIYQTRARAAYWDGRNQIGEPVASGVYFYTFTAGDFTATRRMLILK